MIKQTLIISFFFISTSILFIACDACISIPYLVKNRAHKTVKIKVLNYEDRPCVWGVHVFDKHVIDTIIELRPRQSVLVGCGSKLDFPWGQKNIYRAQKGVEGFDLIQNDTIVKIDKGDNHWKYHHKSSIFSIRRSMLK